MAIGQSPINFDGAVARLTARLFAVVAVTIATSASLVGQAQSLADVARAEEQRRNGTSTASKVYTNADVGGAAETVARTPTSVSAASLGSPSDRVNLFKRIKLYGSGEDKTVWQTVRQWSGGELRANCETLARQHSDAALQISSEQPRQFGAAVSRAGRGLAIRIRYSNPQHAVGEEWDWQCLPVGYRVEAGQLFGGDASSLSATAPVAEQSSACPACPVRDADGRIKRSEAAKRAFQRQTGFPNGRPGYVVDHITALACGGADDASNMQWQTIEDAKAKDKVERGPGCQKQERDVTAQHVDLEFRMKNARDSLRRDENYAEAMETRISDLTADLANRDDPVQRAVIERDRQKAVLELGRLRQSIAAESKLIVDIERDAVRAGIAVRRH